MDIAILDLGSHTLKSGIPYNFPSDGEPSLVRVYFDYIHRSPYPSYLIIALSSVQRPLGRSDTHVRAGYTVQSYIDSRTVWGRSERQLCVTA